MCCPEQSVRNHHHSVLIQELEDTLASEREAAIRYGSLLHIADAVRHNIAAQVARTVKQLGLLHVSPERSLED